MKWKLNTKWNELKHFIKEIIYMQEIRIEKNLIEMIKKF